MKTIPIGYLKDPTKMKQKPFTDKMYLAHKPTGKRFCLAQHWRTGWCVSSWEHPDTEKKYVNALDRLFVESYTNHKEFELNSKEWSLEFDSDTKKEVS